MSNGTGHSLLLLNIKNLEKVVKLFMKNMLKMAFWTKMVSSIR
jgi:hypothetical protein